MARMVKTTTVETAAEDEGKPRVPGEELDEDVIRALTELEGSDEVRWQIHRTAPVDKRGFIKTYSTAELSLERIAQECGEGQYLVKGIRSNGQYYKSRTLSIAPTEKADSLSGIASLLKPDQDKGNHALMVAMMQSNATVLSAALARPEPQKNEIPWSNLFAAVPPALLALKEFFQNRTDPMKQMRDAIELTEKLRGDSADKGNTSWPDLVKEGLSNIPAALAQFKNQPAQSTVQTSPETPLAIPPPDETTMFNLQLVNWMRTKLSQLIEAARRNGNAELYAELFVEELPPGVISDAQVVQLLSREDWFQFLMQFDSRVAPYEGWFAALRENILLNLEPDGKEDLESRADVRAEEPERG